MGVDFVTMVQLIRLLPELKQKRDLLMLGRHRLIIRDNLRDRADVWLGTLEPGLTLDAVTADGPYAEAFFEKLGVGAVQSLDYSDFEGAGIVQDLNAPIPAALQGRFDIVYDGGTLEHVFDVKTAFRNAFDLLRPGGTFIGASPANNFFGHAFYQFGPELVYSFWKRACGCEVLTCQALPELPRFETFELPDPAETGRRLKMRGRQHPVRTHLFYAARKPTAAAAAAPETVLQSDYQHKWQNAAPDAA